MVYAALDYREALPRRFDWQGTCSFPRDATFNVLRVVTKNVLAVTLATTGRSTGTTSIS